jgi:hypothetical protein
MKRSIIVAKNSGLISSCSGAAFAIDWRKGSRLAPNIPSATHVSSI